MKIIRLIFRLQAVDDIFFPAYKGSVFRGAFGHALKESVCVTDMADCASCPLHARCAYVYLFETRNVRGEAVAHPYIMEPPLTSNGHVPKGAVFQTAVILIGRAREYVPHVIQAFIIMGRRGVGRKKGRFSVADVYSVKNGERLYWYNQETRALRQPEQAWETLPGPATSARRLTLHFLTVTALKKQGQLIFNPDFDTLIRAIYRRVKSLSAYHESTQLPPYPEGARTVRMIDNRLRKAGWKRYSNRQGRHIKFEGFTGSITFESMHLGRFWPWIQMGRTLHIGRGTVYGMGKYEVEIIN